MTADVTALRRTAVELQVAQDDLEGTARRLRNAAAALAQQWSGTAADSALQELEGLAQDAQQVAAAHAQAAAVLATCAHAVEEAQATWRHAQALQAQDTEARGRAHARGVFVGPYDSDLQRYARSLARDAQAQAADACARAAAQLRDLAQRQEPRLSAADQIVGAGRGAANAARGTADLLLSLLRDPRGTTQTVAEGVVHGARHPRDAAVAASGWDVLRAGHYGEWAGGLVPDLLAGALSGGALPAGRRAAEVSRRLADLRPPLPGGAVHPRRGAVLTPRYPRTIRPFSPERQRHVLVGDPPPRTGGGHRPGAGRGKSEFPRGWTDDDIVTRVMETARRPLSTKDQPGRPNLLAYAEHHGVCVQVAVDPKGKVVTGYPVAGAVAAAGCGSRRRTA